MDAAPSTRPVIVDVVSDVVCPWCYIGKKRLEDAIALRPEMSVAVRWNPFFLNPWVPREGISREQYLTTKFGSVDRYRQIATRISAAAAAEGLAYDMDKIASQPNTLDCHRLIAWAANDGKAGRMKQRLMELYFAEGADLTRRDVLIAAAVDCGMAADVTRDLLESDAEVAHVEQAAERAKDAGIDGVPFFLFDGKFAVSGAQEAEYLAGALDRAAGEASAAA